MTNSFIKRNSPDRSKINIHHSGEAKCWTRELGVSLAELRKTIERVGNSASAVRKELAGRS